MVEQARTCLRRSYKYSRVLTERGYRPTQRSSFYCRVKFRQTVWTDSSLTSIHPSSVSAYHLALLGGLQPIPAIFGRRRGTLRTSHHFITGPTQTTTTIQQGRTSNPTQKGAGLESNPQPSRCEAPVLTTAPPCCRPKSYTPLLIKYFEKRELSRYTDPYQPRGRYHIRALFTTHDKADCAYVLALPSWPTFKVNGRTGAHMLEFIQSKFMSHFKSPEFQVTSSGEPTVRLFSFLTVF